MSTPKKTPVNVAVEPVFVNKTVAASLLGIGATKLDQLIRDGRLAAHKIDGSTVISPEELRRFAATCPAWEPK